MNIDKETASIILKDLREHNNLTQKEAAQKIGVSLQSWRSWEQGWRNLSDLKMMAIIHILDPDSSDNIATWKERLTAPEEPSEPS